MEAKDLSTPKTGRYAARRTVNWLIDRPLLIELSVLALTVVFGLQMLRVLIPGVVWLLGDRMGLGAVEAGGLAALVFLTAFLAGLVRRLLGDVVSVLVTAGGLGLIVLVVQVWAGDPVVDLTLAMMGTAFFVIFLPVHLRNVWSHGRLSMGHLALGLLVGLAVDTAIHGGFGTYDVSWQSGIGPLLVTLFLVLAQWLLLTGLAFSRQARWASSSDSNMMGVSRWRALTWIALGPFLFLQIVVLQNVARIALLTGWPLPWAFGWTLLAQLLGIMVVAFVLDWGRQTLWPWALVCGLCLIAVTVVMPYVDGAPVTPFLYLLAQVFASLLIVLVFVGLASSVLTKGFRDITLANGLGMVILLLFLLAYYAVYDMSLPYNNTIIEPIAAFLLGACSLAASIGPRQRTRVMGRAWLVPAIAALLLIVPLVGTLTWRAAAPVQGDGLPVRVMTYNLHNGFNVHGRLDMEALAEVIEQEDPDIVALQEVSRGWVVSGRLDMLTWLSQRLDLPYVFGPTADPFWGNAVLSRYPIEEVTHYALPPRDLFILRGYSVAAIDVGNEQRLEVIATHFHHLEEDTGIRQLQAGVVVDYWDGRDSTVLMGDLNAEPEDAEIEVLRQAGLSNAAAAGEPQNTFPSYEPARRIDYLWFSPDLAARDVHVPQSTASDHLPVVAEVYR